MTPTTKPRPRRAPRRQATMTPSAKRYLEEELRWQEHLRRAKTPAPTVIKAARARKLMRHEFTREEQDAMARKGICMLDGSWPIRDARELRKAIRHASPYGAVRDPLRRHCLKRAPGLGLMNLIPWDSWNGDGTLK